MLKRGPVFLFILLGFGALAQETVRVMSYNMLNYPTGNIAGREDTLKGLIDFVEPDILLLQELKNDSGLQLILNESFSNQPGSFAASTFVPQQSNPSSGWLLQQAMIYDSTKFGLVSESYLETSVRDINKFRMYWKDPQLTSGEDTIFFYVFVAHLKSSQGTSNVEARLEMAQTLTTHFQVLEEDANVIFGGDFNLYTSDEPAYQELLDPANSIVLVDPIDSPGNWNSSSFPNKEILTQSTRTSSIFGDGAGGGCDDRFDFILVSSNIMNNWNTVVYEPNSYYALGNNGTCYNQNITECTGAAPDSILTSLYYMSDHLPIIMDLTFGIGNVGVVENGKTVATILLSDGELIINSEVAEHGYAIISDALGRVLWRKKISVEEGRNLIQIDHSFDADQVLILTLVGENQVIVNKQCLFKR